jgi:sulfatase maturation enzyme AslB (radical SAM superfamily)
MDNMIYFPVVPICDAQKLDVKESDLLNSGLYRKCNTLTAGGGYDKFAEIYQKRYGVYATNQFVVQLHGCPLDCWYCYVTKNGVWGKPIMVSIEDLVRHFIESKQEIFHLMGGAPALYLRQWKDLYYALYKARPGVIFHSDFLLIESDFTREDLIYLPGLHAVNVKRDFDCMNMDLFMSNLFKLIQYNVQFYMTFTDFTQEELEVAKNYFRQYIPERFLEDSFNIELIGYKAINHDISLLSTTTKKIHI